MAKQPKALNTSNQSGVSELLVRLRFLFIALVVYRIGTHIPIPGINPLQVKALFSQELRHHFGFV